MKMEIGRFTVVDEVGDSHTVMHIQEYIHVHDPGTALEHVGSAYQMTTGELLSSNDNLIFKNTDSGEVLYRIQKQKVVTPTVQATRRTWNPITP